LFVHAYRDSGNGEPGEGAPTPPPTKNRDLRRGMQVKEDKRLVQEGVRGPEKNVLIKNKPKLRREWRGM